MTKAMSKSVEKGITDAKDFLALGDPSALIFFMATGGLAWGFWLVMPWDVFNATNSFQALQAAPFGELIWGIIFMLVHAWKLWLWHRYRVTKRPNYAQVISNFSIFVLWSIITSSIWISNWHSSATPVYTSITIAAMWITAQRWALVRNLRKFNEGKEVDQ